MKRETLTIELSRAIDPHAWAFIDGHEHDTPPHPAVPFTRARVMKQATDALNRLDSLGMVVVEKEPTVEMMAAGVSEMPLWWEAHHERARDIYRAMLSPSGGGEF